MQPAASTWKINNYIFTKLLPLMGGGEFLWLLLHEVLNNLQAACKGAWQLSPYLKTFCAFSLLKKCKWFSGHYSRIGGTPKQRTG